MTGRELVDFITTNGLLDIDVQVDLPTTQCSGRLEVNSYRVSGRPRSVYFVYDRVEARDDPKAADRRERLMRAVVEHRVACWFGDGQNEEMAEYGSAHFGDPVWATSDRLLLEELGYDIDDGGWEAFLEEEMYTAPGQPNTTRGEM